MKKEKYFKDMFECIPDYKKNYYYFSSKMMLN